MERVRHEAADVAIMTGRQPGHNTVCDHWYPTKTCGRSNPTMQSSWDDVTSPDPGGWVSRERTRRLLAPDGWGPGWMARSRRALRECGSAGASPFHVVNLLAILGLDAVASFREGQSRVLGPVADNPEVHVIGVLPVHPPDQRRPFVLGQSEQPPAEGRLPGQLLRLAFLGDLPDEVPARLDGQCDRGVGGRLGGPGPGDRRTVWRSC